VPLIKLINICQHTPHFSKVVYQGHLHGMRDDASGLKCTELNQNHNGTTKFKDMAEVDQIQKFGFCY
jgi:hypothetical protein